jgi:hypothetical protein
MRDGFDLLELACLSHPILAEVAGLVVIMEGIYVSKNAMYPSSNFIGCPHPVVIASNDFSINQEVIADVRICFPMLVD